jgi:predicted amidohydrolase
MERCTLNAARVFRFPQNPGTLREGTNADVAVFQLLEGDFELVESSAYTGTPEKRIGHRKLVPVATVKDGRLYGSASIPVVRT